jgi:hypothetical protein
LSRAVEKFNRDFMFFLKRKTVSQNNPCFRSELTLFNAFIRESATLKLVFQLILTRRIIFQPR